MDYRSLLIKYMRHVIDREGVSFLDDWERPDDEDLTDEDWDELQRLADLADDFGGDDLI